MAAHVANFLACIRGGSDQRLRTGNAQFAFAVIVTLALGCGSRPAAPPVSKNPSSQAPAIVAPPKVTIADSPVEISDEECLAFAMKLEEAVIADDGHSAGELFAWQDMVDRALEGLSSPENPNEYVEGIRGAASKHKGRLPNTLGPQIKQGGSYKFIRIRSGSGGRRVLFRLLAAGFGVNYHEIILGRLGDKVVGTDMYIYMSGETMSQTIRRIAILGATAGDPSLLQRLRTRKVPLANTILIAWR